MDYQTIAAILFIALMTYFLIKNKDKVKTQGYFPILYFVMYRTRFGLQLMEKFAKKLPRLLKWVAYAGVFIGFLGMIFISVNLVWNIISMITAPAATAGVALVLPFKMKGSFYVPFFYWIISIFVLAAIHEFSHGVISRVYDVKVKSSGFAFLGVLAPVIPAAFVEPDESQLEKKSAGARLSVFAAGPFSNIAFAALVALLFVLLLSPVINTVFVPDGIIVGGYVRDHDNETFPAEKANISKGEVIIKLNNIDVPSIDNFTAVLETTKPGQQITVQTNETAYQITLAHDPADENRSYLGIYVKQSTRISEDFREKYGNILTSSIIWVIGLFYWFYVLNLGIGLFNLVPIGPLDGGKMLYTVLTKYLREDIAIKAWKLISSFFLLLILVIILFAFLK
ncbi:site-2 protease family protein [Candidatus Woesearchaeota archaeon]|nr:site-2 protease family protein [Candidatus Woesearchaeota archaeon]